MSLPSPDDIRPLLKKKLSKKKSPAPNVCCKHCGFAWHDKEFEEQKKLPVFCIRCYKRETAKYPSFSESLVLSAKENIKKRKRKAEKQRGGGKLR